MNIVVSNVKGGVGKTTTTVYLAAAAADRGWDPVTARRLPIGRRRPPSGSRRARSKGSSWSRPPPSGRSARAMTGHRGLAVVDTPPGDERIVRAALERADAVVIPTRAGGVEYSRVVATLEMIATDVGLRRGHLCGPAGHQRPGLRPSQWWTEGKGPDLGHHPRAGRDRGRSRVPALPRRTRCVRRGAQEGAPHGAPRGDDGQARRDRPGPAGTSTACSSRTSSGTIVERTLVGRGQHHVGGGSVVVGPQPVGGGDAPAVTGDQPGKPVLRASG